MRKGNSHVAKTRPERDYYSSYIKSQVDEPTVDESLTFPQTDDDKKDINTPVSKRTRKIPIQQQIVEHLEENWIKWIGGLMTLVLFWLMFESKISIAGIEIKVDGIKDDVKELKETNKETNKHLQDQDLEIREHKIKIEELEQNGAKQPTK